MEGCTLAATITALAIAIAAQIEDTEDLSLLAAAVTQLGDTLALLAQERARSEARAAAKEAKEQKAEEKEAKACPPPQTPV